MTVNDAETDQIYGQIEEQSVTTGVPGPVPIGDG